MTESILPPVVPADPSAGRPRERRRIGGLDVLRGLAAMGVVVSHYTSNYTRQFDPHFRAIVDFPRGEYAVTLFFIISGFVIFMTLEKTRRPVDFVRSRFSRLYPAYWAAVLFTFSLQRILPLHPLPQFAIKFHPSVARAAMNLTMIQEMFGVGNIDSVYWTLQLELCFYFLMFVLFSLKQLGWAEFYLAGVLAVSQFLHWKWPPDAPVWHHHGGWLFNLYSTAQLLMVTGPKTNPDFHLMSFIIGIVLFKLCNHYRPRHLLVLLACLGWFAYTDWGIPFAATLAFTLIIYCAGRGWLWPLENRVLLFLGFISYPLYLTHQSIGYEVIWALLRRGFGPNAAVAIAIAAAVAVATLLTYLVEQPALRLLRAKKPPQKPETESTLPRNVVTVRPAL